MAEYGPPRIGVVRNFFPERCEPEMLAAIDNDQESLAVPEDGKAPFLTRGDEFQLSAVSPENPVCWLWNQAVAEWKRLG